MKLLPMDFVAGPNDVLCGRGQKCLNHIGNKHFQRIVQKHFSQYIRAVTKMDKSLIILDVIKQVRERSPFGGFVRHNPLMDRYYLVNETEARGKTFQAFRDALHFVYKSSNHCKRRTRRQASLLRQKEGKPAYEKESADKAFSLLPEYPASKSSIQENCILLDLNINRGHNPEEASTCVFKLDLTIFPQKVLSICRFPDLMDMQADMPIDSPLKTASNPMITLQTYFDSSTTSSHCGYQDTSINLFPFGIMSETQRDCHSPPMIDHDFSGDLLDTLEDCNYDDDPFEPLPI